MTEKRKHRKKKRNHWWLVVSRKTGEAISFRLNGAIVTLMLTRKRARQFWRAFPEWKYCREVIKVVRA